MVQLICSVRAWSGNLPLATDWSQRPPFLGFCMYFFVNLQLWCCDRRVSAYFDGNFNMPSTACFLFNQPFHPELVPLDLIRP
jgi:hypothetical protein